MNVMMILFVRISQVKSKMKFNKKLFVKRLILTFSTILFIILIFEILFRITYPLYSNYNTEMWRYASESKRISTFPNLGHEHVPNFTNTLYGVEIKTNSLGLRANKEYKIPKPKDIKRILVLGDSITLGWGVKLEDTYPQILESLLNFNSTVTYEVINSGVGNYNAKNELANLKKLVALDPDIIILGFYINDIEENTYPSKIQLWIKSKSYFYAFISDKLINLKYKNNFEKYYLNLYEDKNNKESLKQTIDEMIRIANNNLIPFVFVNIPEFHKFENYPFTQVNQFIETEIVMDQNITYVNLLSIFDNKSVLPEDIWVSIQDTHPNVVGHKIIAQSIYENLPEILNN